MSKPKQTALNTFSPATDMLTALHEGQISALELFDLHLERIERYNPQLNAIVTPDYDRARQTAIAADETRAQGQDKPLLGLPIVIKDCIYVAGLPTTGGIPDRAQAIASSDAQIVARLRTAGAVIMGKTNVPPYAADWQSNNPIFGRSNNPWNLEHTPGGSTGGGAAVIAAGLSPLEVGGDLGGSIRIPAAFCGIYGHKSSETALPRGGHFPGPNYTNPVIGMSVLGPLARSAADLKLAFKVMAGPDIGEDVAWRLELPPPRHKRLADYRVAVLPPIAWLSVDAEIMAAQDKLVTELGRTGATVKVTQPQKFGDLRAYYKIYRSILWALSSAGMSKAERHKQADKFRASGDEFLTANADGLEATAADYLKWFARREKYRAAYRDFFQEWDILLAPANIVNAFPHTDLPYSQRKLKINGQDIPYHLQSLYPSLGNLSGQPSTAFPLGLTQAGLPIGLQALGPYLEDRTTLHFAALIEQTCGGFQPPPGYT